MSVVVKFAPERTRPETGALLNAEFRGAKTVNGPGPLRVVTRLA